MYFNSSVIFKIYFKNWNVLKIYLNLSVKFLLKLKVEILQMNELEKDYLGLSGCLFCFYLIWEMKKMYS